MKSRHTRKKHRCPHCEPLGLRDGVPVLPAYHNEGCNLMVWCHYCEYWHFHGDCGDPNGSGGDGHRRPECDFNESPYKVGGYYIKRVGVLTREIKRQHHTIPFHWHRDLTPLSFLNAGDGETGQGDRR